VISVTGVLYFSYMSKIQLVNQLEELNNRVLKLEKRVDKLEQ